MIGKKFNYWTVLQSAPSRNGRAYWLCKCECGTIREVSQANLKRGHSKSCGCLRKKKASETHLKDLTGQRFGSLLVVERDYSKSQNGHRYACWKCLCDCGEVIIVTSDNLKRQRSCGCVKSQGEQEIAQILQNNNISYTKEKTFSDLNRLRYDFYLPEYNRLIEFDGKQHYEANDFFGGQEAFLSQQERDQIKNEYAKQHNVELVRIPYTKRGSILLEDLLGTQYLI